MSIGYKPSTTLGNWSVRLIVISILFFLVLAAFIASGQRGGDTFFSNLLLTIPMLSASILAIGSFFTGILSIIKNRERAVFVFISTVIGSFVLFFMLAEILFPH
jgi:cytochrome bd-type quinol oxidase subunit 2